LGAVRFLIEVVNGDEVSMLGRLSGLRSRRLADLEDQDTPGVGVEEHAIEFASEDIPILSEDDLEV
jgi:hypothetical protein